LDYAKEQPGGKRISTAVAQIPQIQRKSDVIPSGMD
jgi:hypothetical protein